MLAGASPRGDVPLRRAAAARCGDRRIRAELDAATDAAASPAGFYIEAEAGELSGGFEIGEDPLASAESFLQPPAGVTSDAMPGEARALYALTIDTAGSYRIWGRIHSPDADHNRVWFQLDDGPRGSSGA